MESLIHYLSNHPIAIIVLIFIGLFILYFIFKQLVKLALIFTLVLAVVAGYFYFQGTRDLREALEKTRAQTGQLLEKGKGAVDKGKDLYEKGKKATEGVGSLFGKDEKKPGKD